jgi:hypothetical protein
MLLKNQKESLELFRVLSSIIINVPFMIKDFPVVEVSPSLKDTVAKRIAELTKK